MGAIIVIEQAQINGYCRNLEEMKIMTANLSEVRSTLSF